MKYLRKMNSLADYQLFVDEKGSDYVEPHVVYIPNDDLVKYGTIIPNEIIAIYDNWSTGKYILSSSFDMRQIDKMYMNGVEITPTYSPNYLNNPVKIVMKKTFNNCRCMFYGCEKLTSLDLSSFDTSKVTDMGFMFQTCKLLTSLDVSSFDTSNVTSMNEMFYGCSKLTSLDVSSFDTSNVTSMYKMFNSCSKLVSLDLSSFDTSNVTSMNEMFRACLSLTSLNLSSFNTSKVTNMDYMFQYCEKLTSLDLSSFNISNVTGMYYMFSGCSLLTDLNPFYNWKQGKVDLSNSPITPLAVHQLIERSMNASDGAIARTLQLKSTTKSAWVNSEYYTEDLALLQVKNITIA